MGNKLKKIQSISHSQDLINGSSSLIDTNISESTRPILEVERN